MSPFDMVDEAVCAAQEMDLLRAQRWLEAAREHVSFLRVREIVLKLMQRLEDMNKLLTAIYIIRRVDPMLIPRVSVSS